MSEKLFSNAELLEELGPAPTIEATAEFLRESPQLTYNRLYRKELEKLPGLGVIKISLASILEYVNGREAHVAGTIRNPNGRRGKRTTVGA
jgi:hypothetical protein